MGKSTAIREELPAPPAPQPTPITQPPTPGVGGQYVIDKTTGERKRVAH